MLSARYLNKPCPIFSHVLYENLVVSTAHFEAHNIKTITWIQHPEPQRGKTTVNAGSSLHGIYFDMLLCHMVML